MTIPSAAPGTTDFHNHLMPGVDDGAPSVAAAAAALRRFRAEGIGQIIATPHFTGSLTLDPAGLAKRLSELDAGWVRLRQVADENTVLEGNALRLERGAEVMLDVPEPDLSDPRVRLAGGPFVLVEYPGLQLPPNAEYAVTALRSRGWRPVVAHPERYRNLDSQLTQLVRLRQAGALLQVNSGSLFGDYGRVAARYAGEILSAGWANYVCSDNHARVDPGAVRFASALSEGGFAEQAELLLATNPGRLLAGDLPLPVPPMQAKPARPWWSRLLGGGA